MNKKNSVFIIILLVIVLIYTFSGNSIGIYPDFGDDALTVSAFNRDWTIRYDQIVSVELTQLPELGTMIEGIDKNKLRCGTFENEAWGTYTLCILPQVKDGIVITRKDGSLFVLNYENAESTAELHRMFTELLQSKGHPIE